MKISTILDHIDSGHMALPEFQRGYVWNRDQVRNLFDSLYRGHPVGSLLVWATESKTAEHRGDGQLAAGIVKLLLDGQQRITSLYGVIRGRAPKFFEGNEQAFTGLHFHLEDERFQFYQRNRMKDDPLWVDVSKVMQLGNKAIGEHTKKLQAVPSLIDKIGDYFGRISQLLAIRDINLHIEEVTGEDKTLDVVVDIFNRVNSGGTKLSKGDLALAKISAEWPAARDTMHQKIAEWETSEYHFTRDWLLRSVNTILTGEAKFSYLHDVTAEEIENGLARASRHIDTCLNLIAGRLGLDHDRVFFGRFAIPVIVRYLDQCGDQLNAIERDRILFWYVQSGMWGRFSSSTETVIDQDLETLKESGNNFDALIDQLRLARGSLRVQADHFTSWSVGARFYPVLYMLTRMGEAKDWGNGLPLKANMLGKMSALEVHHIFPRSLLYDAGYDKTEVNALANFCFLTKNTNLRISNRRPQDYFREIEEAHPGALESQWIPMDSDLWRIERFPDFLEARRQLLAKEANKRFEELLHGAVHLLDDQLPIAPTKPQISTTDQKTTDDVDLDSVNRWVTQQGLVIGETEYDYADPDTGQQIAIFDLAWPEGLQPGLTTPVALLLSGSTEAISAASSAGYRCFTTLNDFYRYVNAEILQAEPEAIGG